MSGRTVSGVVAPPLHEAAQQAADYEGVSMSALVSAALTLYLSLPASARRTARYVMTRGIPELRQELAEGCGRAIARAGNSVLSAEIAARAATTGFGSDATPTEQELAEQSVQAVGKVRRSRDRAHSAR